MKPSRATGTGRCVATGRASPSSHLHQAAYLEQTITSVLEQNYPSLEYMVIDGGSTDGSVDIIRKYEDRLSYWVSERDGGQAHALNKGFGRATGEILAYLNSDDYYLPGALDRVANYLRVHPDVALVHGRCRVVDVAGVKLGERFGSRAVRRGARPVGCLVEAEEFRAARGLLDEADRRPGGPLSRSAVLGHGL